jgi:hypothetical protein
MAGRFRCGARRENPYPIVVCKSGAIWGTCDRRIFGAWRRLLVQWVPHGYGYKSMNLGFCAWLWARSVLRRDHVELMVHEPFFSFGEGAWRQNLVALVHRLMTVIVLAAARRVWVSIPAWESMLKPWAWIGRADFGWLPVPSNVPVDYKQAETRSIRRAYLGGEQRLLIGHFGTHGTPFLEEVVESLLRNHPDAALLFMGRASQEFRDCLEHKFPEFAGRLHASGVLSPVALSHHFSACDLMLQPYIDGISSRRTSAMSALAHGLPVVTTIGRLTETLWRDGEAVALAPVGDAAAFIAEAHALLSDSEKRRGLGERARALYQDRFDICHVVAALRNSPQALSQCVS